MSTHIEFQRLTAKLIKNSRSTKTANPSIYPIPIPSIGNRISENNTKFKRTWSPNVQFSTWPVNLLGGDKYRGAEKMAKIKMKMVVRDNKKIEYKGGLEAALIGTSPIRLSDEGRQLRTALFKELYRIKEDLDATDLTEGQKVRRKALRVAEERRRLLSWYKVIKPEEEQKRVVERAKRIGGEEGQELPVLDGKKDSDVAGLIQG